MTLVLQRGDYFLTEFLSIEDYMMIGRALVASGAHTGEFPNQNFLRATQTVGWQNSGNRIYHSNNPIEHFAGRQLTAAEVLASIKQRESKEWKPKVGEECEFSFGRFIAWAKITPKYIGNDFMIAMQGTREEAMSLKVFKFRQIKSEKDIAVEQLTNLIRPVNLTSTNSQLAEIIYNDGWRKV